MRKESEYTSFGVYAQMKELVISQLKLKECFVNIETIDEYRENDDVFEELKTMLANTRELKNKVLKYKNKLTQGD